MTKDCPGLQPPGCAWRGVDLMVWGGTGASLHSDCRMQRGELKSVNRDPFSKQGCYEGKGRSEAAAGAALGVRFQILNLTFRYCSVFECWCKEFKRVDRESDCQSVNKDLCLPRDPRSLQLSRPQQYTPREFRVEKNRTLGLSDTAHLRDNLKEPKLLHLIKHRKALKSLLA